MESNPYLSLINGARLCAHCEGFGLSYEIGTKVTIAEHHLTDPTDAKIGAIAAAPQLEVRGELNPKYCLSHVHHVGTDVEINTVRPFFFEGVIVEVDMFGRSV